MKNINKISIVFLAFLGFLAQSAQADAWEGGWGRSHRSSYHHGYHRSYPSYGKVVVSLPRTHISFVFGSSRYYYCDGVYYRKHRAHDYVVVEPPRGAIIRIPPPEYNVVVVNGITYYESSGVYYLSTGGGYQVVPTPNTTVVQTVQALPSAPIQNAPIFDMPTQYGQESFTVNIPNDNGGYTPITLRKSENGFVGPQGEFYKEFPRVEQLKFMYAK